jgi:hypothetical protein
MRWVLPAVFVLARFVTAYGGGEADLPVFCVEVLRSNVSEAIARSSAGVTTNVFQSAGINVQWVHQEPGYRSLSDERCKTGTTHVLVILSRTSPRKNDERVLAEAAVGGPITAYYHHIQTSARRHRVDTDVLCGYVLAHEIGHVLLRSREHSNSGLMRSSWDNEDYGSMIARRLHFDSAATAAIRSQLRSTPLVTAARD